MADVFHRSGEEDAERHWWVRYCEISKQLAAMKETVFFDARIAEAAEAYVAAPKTEDGAADIPWADLLAAIHAKREHLKAAVETPDRKLNGRGRAP